MNSFWLAELANYDATALWAVGISATACAVLLSWPLRRAPRWRSAVIGLAVMLFSAPVYSLAFDAWWAPPWPSIYVATAVAAGNFKHALLFFHRQFLLPPFAWGILGAFVWHSCSDALSRRPANGPPFA